MQKSEIARQLKRFAENGCRGQSPLYEQLCLQIAEEDRLLELLKSTSEGQPVPNMILAAVHFLLLGGEVHELAAYYGSCTDSPLPGEEAFPHFRDFCLQHEDEIRTLLQTRRVQTNEVRRCSYLFPAFHLIAREYAEFPLALIEVGCSAGLLLNWDRYGYQYQDDESYGEENANVKIQAKWKRGSPEQLIGDPPQVADRIGLDLNTIDLSDPVEARWLQALTWPDQPIRRTLLQTAITEFQQRPVPLQEGDALAELVPLIETISEEMTVCVFHCHVLNQFSEEHRVQFASLLEEAAQQRPIVELSAEWIRTPNPELWLTHRGHGESTTVHLADVDHHGRWVKWKNDCQKKRP